MQLCLLQSRGIIMVEPIRKSLPAKTGKMAKRSSYNVFQTKTEQGLIDLLTDRGTGAKATKWAGIDDGDESYAGATFFLR